MIFFSSFVTKIKFSTGKVDFIFDKKVIKHVLNKMHIQLPNLRPLQDVTKKLKFFEKLQKYTICAWVRVNRDEVFLENVQWFIPVLVCLIIPMSLVLDY